MYRIEEKEQAIRTVQQHLLIISQKDSGIPHIVVDGVYTEETRNAVSEFQKSRALIVTGTVDKTTFDILYFEANQILKENEKRRNVIEHEKFPLRIGDSGNDVSNLNTILRELSNYYIDLFPLPYGNYFSKDTESAVIYMQRIFRENQDGEVTVFLYERLNEELGERKKFIKTGKPS